MVVQLGEARHAVQGSYVCSPASAMSSPLVGRPWPCSSEMLAMRFGARAHAVRQVPSLPLQSVDHGMQLRDTCHAVQSSCMCNLASVRACAVQRASVHNSASATTFSRGFPSLENANFWILRRIRSLNYDDMLLDQLVSMHSSF
uniref:Uncharacterized protein n=1 Tax=Triticum urartu TaxID=4572 RepID=A0A8R7PPX3_TRIUA